MRVLDGSKRGKAGATGALDTLNEIATQLANDQSAVSTLTAVIGALSMALRIVPYPVHL